MKALMTVVPETDLNTARKNKNVSIMITKLVAALF